MRPDTLRRTKLTCYLGSDGEVFRSLNSVLNPVPSQIRIKDYTESEVLEPKGYFKLPIIYHADRIENVDFRLMFVYRLVRPIFLVEARRFSPGPHAKDDGGFRSTRASLSVQVQPAFEISVSSKPGGGGDAEFLLSLEVENTTPSTWLRISQTSTMSPSWTCHSPTDGFM